MAMNLNRVQLIGRLGADPEVRVFEHSGKDAKVCNARLIVNREYTNSKGDRVKETQGFNITAWNKLGEILGDWGRKGRLIYIEGRLQTDRYEVDGETRYATKIVASNLIFLDAKRVEEAPDMAEEEAEEMPF